MWYGESPISRSCRSLPAVRIKAKAVIVYTAGHHSLIQKNSLYPVGQTKLLLCLDRDWHRTVYGYGRKNYGFLRVLTGRNRNRKEASGGSYGYGTVHLRVLRSYTVVKNEIKLNEDRKHMSTPPARPGLEEGPRPSCISNEADSSVTSKSG
jgi:hypothetical protein